MALGLREGLVLVDEDRGREMEGMEPTRGATMAVGGGLGVPCDGLSNVWELGLVVTDSKDFVVWNGGLVDCSFSNTCFEFSGTAPCSFMVGEV